MQRNDRITTVSSLRRIADHTELDTRGIPFRLCVENLGNTQAYCKSLKLSLVKASRLYG